MRFIIALLLSAFVSGCATSVKVNNTDHYKDIERMEAIEVEVEEYPNVEASVVKHNGESLATFNKTEFDKLRELRAKANKNAETLTAVIAVNNALITERNILLEAAKGEERRANSLERDYARAEEKLRYEEQKNLVETSIYKVIIIGLIGVAL